MSSIDNQRQGETPRWRAYGLNTRRQPFGEGRLDAIFIRTATLVSVLLVWEVWGRSTNRALFTPPSRVLTAFYESAIASGELWEATLDSLGAMLLGFGLAIPAGVVIGAAMGRYSLVEYLLDPYLSFVFAVPIVAYIPLLIVWLGLGMTVRIFIIFFICLYPIVINTMAGAKEVKQALIDVALVNCATERQTLRTVVIPSILPYIFTGVQLTIGNALIGTILGELLIVARGLGRMILTAAFDFRPDLLIVPLLIIIALSLTMSRLLAWLRPRIMPWSSEVR